MSHIVSASRRSDIPQFYAEWFRNRRREGFVEYRTVYGGGKNGYFRASLLREDVLGYLFWTKFAGPFHEELRDMRNEGIPYVFQYTITGYGTEIQPRIPPAEKTIDDFLQVAANLPAADAIQWRYDPILISTAYNADWHRKNFSNIASKLKGATRVVNVSFTEPYLKAIAKTDQWKSIRWRQLDPRRHKTVIRKYPDLQLVGQEEEQLLTELEEIARSCGINLRVCCNMEYDTSFPLAQCCSPEMFASYGESIFKCVSALQLGHSRDQCRCLKSVDIGMDTTCPGGCFYCYVTTSRERALKNYEMHNPVLPRLRFP